MFVIVVIVIVWLQTVIVCVCVLNMFCGWMNDHCLILSIFILLCHMFLADFVCVLFSFWLFDMNCCCGSNVCMCTVVCSMYMSWWCLFIEFFYNVLVILHFSVLFLSLVNLTVLLADIKGILSVIRYPKVFSWDTWCNLEWLVKKSDLT